MMHSLDTFQSRLDRIRHNLAQTDTINKQSSDNFTIKRQSYQEAVIVSPSREEPTELEWTLEKKELSEHKSNAGIDQEGLRRRNQELRSMDMPQPSAQISQVTNHTTAHSTTAHTVLSNVFVTPWVHFKDGFLNYLLRS